MSSEFFPITIVILGVTILLGIENPLVPNAMMVVALGYALWPRRQLQRPSFHVEAFRWLTLLAAPVSLSLLRLAMSEANEGAMAQGDSYAGIVVEELVWLCIAIGGMHFLGITLRNDISERNNVAAMLAAIGAILGAGFGALSLTHIPSEQPREGWGLVALCLFLGAWWIFEHRTGLSEAITVERDLGAGLRLGAFLITAGLLAGRLGRYATESWVPSTLGLLALMLVALAVEHVLARRITSLSLGRRPMHSAFAPGLLYLVPALVYTSYVMLPR